MAKKRNSKGVKDEMFKRAVEWVLEHEGGYVDHPSDPGGETNFGISKRSYPAEDIKSMTREKAEAIYKRDFWDPYSYEDIESDAIAFKVFDLSINMGSARAHAFLQGALRKYFGFYAPHRTDVKIDGVLGPITAAATNEAVAEHGEEKVMKALQERAEKFYRSLGKTEFLRGWLRRLRKVYTSPESELENAGEESAPAEEAAN